MGIIMKEKFKQGRCATSLRKKDLKGARERERERERERDKRRERERER